MTPRRRFVEYDHGHRRVGPDRNPFAGERFQILHVIDSLGISGGAEQQLALNLRHFSDERLEHHVAYVHESGDGDRVQEVAARVAAIHPLSSRAGARRIGRLAIIRRLTRLVDDVEPDLIHCTLADACLASRLVGCWKRLPVVESLVNISHEAVRVRDNPNVAQWKLAIHRLVDRLTMPCVTRFHALSDVVARSWAETVGIPESKIQVIPRGIDVEALKMAAGLGRSREELLDELGLDHEATIVLNVGRHEPQKGQRYLIEAMEAVLAARPDVVLIIAGREGNSTRSLEATVERLGLSGSVFLLGPVTDVPSLMRAADLFVFPSLFEGLGVSLLEALALGVPVVATDIEPLDEICDHGRSGILVEPANAAALADGVLAVVDQIETAAERACRVQMLVGRRFPVSESSMRMELLYLGILERAAG